MNRDLFFNALRNGLSGLPQDTVEEHLAFYGEMLDDRMEEGYSEEAAIAELGNIDDIIAQIKADTPLTKIVKEKIARRRKLTTLEILLIIVGFPIWFSLLVSVFAVVFSIYISWWAVLISLWSVFVSLAVSAFSCIVAGIIFACIRHVQAGMIILSAGFICAGLSILVYYGCKAVTKGTTLLSKKVVLWLKNKLTRKEYSPCV